VSELDAVSEVEQITDHVAGGTSLLPDSLRRGVSSWQGAWLVSKDYARGDLVAYDGDAWRALVDVASGGSAPAEGAAWTAQTGTPVALLSVLGALLMQVQDLEDAAFPLAAQTIDTAATHALTAIGDLVGLRRLDATTITDARYRIALKAWVRAMRSNGAIGDIEEVMTILAGSALAAAWTVTEHFPAGLLVTPASALLTDESYIAAIAHAVRAAGVRLQVICPPASDPFTLAVGDEEPEASATLGWSNVAQSTGGYLAGVVE